MNSTGFHKRGSDQGVTKIRKFLAWKLLTINMQIETTTHGEIMKLKYLPFTESATESDYSYVLVFNTISLSCNSKTVK